MKKFLTILIALTLGLTLLVPALAEQTTELTFLRIGNDEAERAYWQWTIEAFQKENPGIVIQYDEAAIGEPMETKLNTLFASGSGPDLIGHGILSVAQRVSLGHYQPVDAYFDSWEGKDDIMPAVLANGTYEGKVYGLAYSVTPYVFAYRIDLLEEAGIAVPTTWDELAVAARALTEKDDAGAVTFSGFCFPQTGGNLVELDVFVYGNGGSYLSADSEPTFEGNEQIAGALAFLQGRLPDVNMIYSINEVNPFVAGKAAMTLINNAALTTMITNPEYEGKVGLALPPNNGTMASFCGCNMLFIGRDCQNPEAAFKFISFALGQESALKRAEMVRIPVTRKSLAEQYATMDQWNAARVACVEYGTGMPRVTWSTGFQQVRNALSQSVLFGDVAIDEALSQAQKDIAFRMEQ
ncbi:MAG: extracellular solute-binding protein [Clostridiales bacterium]|nr:extracellular solute-binding protein [Clostridiales bacterium]